MRKFISVLVLSVLVFSAKAQDGNLKSQTYFRFGYSLPSWKYMGMEQKSDWASGVKRAGGVFELGSIYMLNSIKLAPGMRIGINVDYLSLGYNRFKFDELSTYKSTNFMTFGSKIGPSFSYSPVKHLVIDACFKFNPVWAAANYTTSNNDLVDDQFYLGFMGIKYAIGLNVRYTLLMAGFEFNPGYLKMKRYDSDQNEFVDEYYGNVNDNGKKTPAPAFNFTLGLSF
jgi:hypothetical protein